MIKVGVVGVGEMGSNHARVYSELSGEFDLKLVGVSDKNSELAESVADEYNYMEYYEDSEDLAEQELDAVSIAVPTSKHKDMALPFIERGTNVLIEKPIADNVKDGRRILQAADENDVRVLVGHIERYNPAVLKLKKVIENGALGNLMSISAKRVGPLAVRVRDVGIIKDSAVHDFDVISYLFGEKADKVTANAGNAKHPADIEDHAQIMVDFNNGKSGIVETNWLTPHKTRELSAVGSKAIAYLDYIDQSLTVHNEDWEKDLEIKKREPLKNELEDFISCTLNGEEPKVCGEDGVHVLKVALSAKKSSKENRKIQVE